MSWTFICFQPKLDKLWFSSGCKLKIWDRRDFVFLKPCLAEKKREPEGRNSLHNKIVLCSASYEASSFIEGLTFYNVFRCFLKS